MFGIDISDAALIALATMLLRAAGLVLSGQQSRQRDLFSKAYGSAMAWNELLYRVRRRANTPEAEAALVNRFHDLQEQIDYYEGWTASEGAAIGRSYCLFVKEVKEATESLLQEAWLQPGRTPGAPVSQAGFDGDSEARIPPGGREPIKPWQEKGSTQKSCWSAAPGWSSSPAVRSPT